MIIIESFLWLSNKWNGWKQTYITYPIIEIKDMQWLDEQVSHVEVKNAVFFLNLSKALGPDGFPTGFYQQLWDIVGKKVCDFVIEVWMNSSEIAKVNETDIFLIPKVMQPQTINQFWPIFLCNEIYKMVSKMVVNRIKACILKLVSPYQTTFMPGRNIHENIIIAKEVLHNMHDKKGKKWYFVVKVDLSKAYDKII